MVAAPGPAGVTRTRKGLLLAPGQCSPPGQRRLARATRMPQRAAPCAFCQWPLWADPWPRGEMIHEMIIEGQRDDGTSQVEAAWPGAQAAHSHRKPARTKKHSVRSYTLSDLELEDSGRPRPVGPVV